MSNKSGVNKSFKIYLDTALNKKRFPVLGRFLQITDTSSASVVVDVAVASNKPDSFETGLKKDASIYEGSGFDVFYITAEAQAGEWLRIVISDGPEDYAVKNPGGGVIDGIADAVKVKNDTGDTLDVSDTDGQAAIAAVEAAVDDVNALLQDDEALRAPLTTLENASYGNAGTLVSSGANVNGVIIRTASLCSGTQATGAASVTAGGSAIAQVGGNYTSLFIKDVFIPAGVALAVSNSGSASSVNVWYEVL